MQKKTILTLFAIYIISDPLEAYVYQFSEENSTDGWSIMNNDKYLVNFVYNTNEKPRIEVFTKENQKVKTM
jgi:hypothetical protein